LAQEVLAETAGPGDLEYEGAHGAGAGEVGGDDQQTKTALQLLAETQEQKEQLDRRCEEKDREVGLHSHFWGFSTHGFHFPHPPFPPLQIAALRREVARNKQESKQAGTTSSTSSPGKTQSVSDDGSQRDLQLATRPFPVPTPHSDFQETLHSIVECVCPALSLKISSDKPSSLSLLATYP